jgi:hypothetical protein
VNKLHPDLGLEILVMLKKWMVFLVVILVLLNGACLPLITGIKESGDGREEDTGKVSSGITQKDPGDVSGDVPEEASQSALGKFFSEELQRAGVERIGQPIEGFSAFIYLEAFPGFEESDFNGVQSLEGIYKLEGDNLNYKRTARNLVTSAEETISEEGYGTLLQNFSKRVGIEVFSEADIAALLEKLREVDVYPDSFVFDDFSIWLPEGWFAYDRGYSVIFLHDPDFDFDAIGATEGFALAPYIQVIRQEMDLDVLLEQNLWTESSEFIISIDQVRIGYGESIRVLSHAAGAGGLILNYVFDAEDSRVYTLSIYPYEAGSQDTDDFERAVQSFMIN